MSWAILVQFKTVHVYYMSDTGAADILKHVSISGQLLKITYSSMHDPLAFL